jgi:hypothetical protein
MSIIDVEIAKRQAIIDSKEEKLAKAVRLREEADVLESEAEAIDTTVLTAEIEELATYLPHIEDDTESVGE